MKLDIQSPNTNLSPELRLHIERRLQFALSRFGTRIGQVTVRLSSLTGLKGGIDNHCRIEVLVLPSGQAVVERTDADFETVVDRAMGRIGQSVSQILEQQGHWRRSHRVLRRIAIRPNEMESET